MADGDAGPIIISASDHVAFLESSPGGRPGGIFNNSFGDRGSLGNAGDVVITTPNLQLTGGTRINTTTASSGRGGNVTINADSISMSGENSGFEIEPLFNLGTTQSSGIFTSTIGGNCTGPCGNAGNISITTGSLIMGSGAQINSGTSSSGQGGNITITAANTIGMSGTLTTGQPGGIQSRAIGTDLDAGAGGNISLIAGQSVNISNGAAVSASTTGPGNAGNILVKANDITISGGGTITAASTGAGNAGTVTIQGINSPANSFLIDGAGSGVFTTTSDTGTGGNISIDANAVTLQNGAHLSSSSTGAGNAGNIQINAGNQFAMTNSTVTTEANQSSGGAIKITTNPNGTVQLTDSTISASVLDGTGGGGSVNIDPQFVVLQNSQILANAVFRAWREYLDHDQSPVTGFDQSNLGLLAVWPARHDHHSIAHFSSQRQDRSSRAEAAARDHALEPTLRSTRRWERQQLYRRRTGRLACRTRRMAFKSLGINHWRIGGQHGDRARNAHKPKRVHGRNACRILAADRPAGVPDPELCRGLDDRLYIITREAASTSLTH